MTTEINEPIDVVAVFDRDLKPVKFKWRGRVYGIREITYTWRSRDGGASFVHFSVSDGASLYELTYNQATMKWRLEHSE